MGQATRHIFHAQEMHKLCTQCPHTHTRTHAPNTRKARHTRKTSRNNTQDSQDTQTYNILHTHDNYSGMLQPCTHTAHTARALQELCSDVMESLHHKKTVTSQTQWNVGYLPSAMHRESGDVSHVV